MRIGISATVVASATIAALISSTNAHAIGGGSWTTNDVKIRKSPNTSSTIVDRGYKGDSAVIYCKKIGESVFGDKLWYKVKNNSSSSGAVGYSSAYYMTTGAAPIDYC
ncbi:SH3 domain-containing protein [Streptomyces sp. NPDC059506]|uniref:SH3 domain-containing protein n=1 Tax=Streptomyces TaxID=1883 RepID=UPI0036A53003